MSDVIKVFRDLGEERDRPFVQVELCDGTGTNVTRVYLEGRTGFAATLAAGEAFSLFVAGLAGDSDVLDERLAAG
jgi:hypothetical protein